MFVDRTALSTGYKFLKWIALPTLWTTRDSPLYIELTCKMLQLKKVSSPEFFDNQCWSLFLFFFFFPANGWRLPRPKLQHATRRVWLPPWRVWLQPAHGLFSRTWFWLRFPPWWSIYATSCSPRRATSSRRHMVWHWLVRRLVWWLEFQPCAKGCELFILDSCGSHAFSLDATLLPICRAAHIIVWVQQSPTQLLSKGNNQLPLIVSCIVLVIVM